MNKLKLVSFILCIVLQAVFSACTQSTSTDTALTVIRDVTDSNITFPKSEEVQRLLTTANDMWSGVQFRFTFIDDVEYGREYYLSVPSKKSLLGNELERKKEVKHFCEQVDSTIRLPITSKRDYSVVYPVIIREINRMSEDKEDERRIVAVYSDLLENTNILSMLNSTQKFDEQLWQSLEKSYGIKLNDNLQGIEVYFVYQAKDLTASHQFSAVSKLYKQQLEKRGAKVTITANL